MLIMEESFTYLKEKLNDQTDSVEYVWSTFKELGKAGFVESHLIDLIISWVVDEFEGEAMLRFTLQRIFTLYENGEPADADKQRIRCELFFPLTEELKKIECTELSMDYESFEEFFDHVEKLDCFNITSKLKPHAIQIVQADY